MSIASQVRSSEAATRANPEIQLIRMNRFRLSKLRFLPVIAAAILTAAIGLVFGGCESGAPQKAGANPGSSSVQPVATRASLTGAELYAINCNRCHPERSAIERRSTEWKTILTHMRVRANLPAAQARAILQYLQENSGS